MKSSVIRAMDIITTDTMASITKPAAWGTNFHGFDILPEGQTGQVVRQSPAIRARHRSGLRLDVDRDIGGAGGRPFGDRDGRASSRPRRFRRVRSCPNHGPDAVQR